MYKINNEKFIFFFFLFFAFSIKAQDTLKINLQQADSIFIANNFYLLAASMNVEAQKAQIIQAQLYPNPTFTVDLNAYDGENNRVFHIGKTGEKAFQVEQLILLGGKRKAEIEIAKTNSQIAELEFLQLARQLKFRLHSDLFAIGQQQVLLSRYNSQLALLDTLLFTYQRQADNGNIPLKEVVRLKGAYLKLNNDRAELLQKYFETQTDLQILLQTSSHIEFQFSEKEIEKYIKLHSLTEITSLALLNRPELLIIEKNKTLAEQNLRYQKSLAIPDINLHASYDQRGNAFNNQISAGISFSLPFWDRNQGNIKFSQFKIKEADYNLQAMQKEIIANVQNTFALYSQTASEYLKATSLYNEDFEVTLKGMRDNFQNRNISIVEFIDFFEAYNEALTELARIRTQLVVLGEQLNLLIGQDIY